MKKMILSLFLAIIGLMAHATTRTVSNLPLIPAQYSSIDAAIATSANNDTILIYGTENNYGDCSITKPITLIGVGHNAQQQGTHGNVLCGNVYTPFSNLSGINLYGLEFINFNPNLKDNINNVSIQFCKIGGSIGLGASSVNYTIKNNIFYSHYTSIYGGSQPYANNILIINNIIDGAINSLNGTNNLIINNVFINPPFGFAFYQGSPSVSNAIIANNVFYNATFSNGTSGSGTASNCSFNNNITYYFGGSSNLPTGNGNSLSGNIQNTDPLFMNYPAAGAIFSYSYDFRLLPNSPGKNAGTDGTDIGVYGNNNIFSMTGESTIPYVRAFNIVMPLLPVGGTLNVNFTGSDAFPGGN